MKPHKFKHCGIETNIPDGVTIIDDGVFESIFMYIKTIRGRRGLNDSVEATKKEIDPKYYDGTVKSGGLTPTPYLQSGQTMYRFGYTECKEEIFNHLIPGHEEGHIIIDRLEQGNLVEKILETKRGVKVDLKKLNPEVSANLVGLIAVENNMIDANIQGALELLKGDKTYEYLQEAIEIFYK